MASIQNPLTGARVDPRSDSPRTQRIVAKSQQFQATGRATTTPVDLTDNPLSPGTIQALQLTSDLVNQFNRLSPGERGDEGLIQVIGQQKEQALRLLTNQFQLGELSDEGLSRAEGMLAVLPTKPPDVRFQPAGAQALQIEASPSGAATATPLTDPSFAPPTDPALVKMQGIRNRMEGRVELLKAEGREEEANLVQRDIDELTGIVQAGAGTPSFDPRAAATAITEEQVTDAQDALTSSISDFNAVNEVRQKFAETPEAGGILGLGIEAAGGVIRQVPLIGPALLEAVGVGEERETRVVKARTEARALTSRLLTQITQEESGRFTDKERELAADVLRALKPAASTEQINAAFDTVMTIQRRSIVDAAFQIMRAQNLDLNNDDDTDKFIDAMIEFGMSEAQAIDAFTLLIQRINNPQGLLPQ